MSVLMGVYFSYATAVALRSSATAPSLYWLVSSFSDHIHTPPSLYWLVYSFHFKAQYYWICIDMLTMLVFGVC